MILSDSAEKSKMSTQFTTKGKRFSIDDAFEEETDEAIKVYGSTNPRLNCTPKNHFGNCDQITVNIDNGRYVQTIFVFAPVYLLLVLGRIKLPMMHRATAIRSFRTTMNVQVKKT